MESYQIRLDGTNLEHYYGTRRTGFGVEKLTSDDERELLMAQYSAVLARKAPGLLRGRFHQQRRRLFTAGQADPAAFGR